MNKILICPWFGPLPEWWPKYEEHIKHLKAQGYDFLLTNDVDDFKLRCKEKLGVDAPIVEGGSKIHDFRATFGVLYADEIKGYDFWGHTDFDMVYGDVNKFFPDKFYENLDIHSNHDTYMCGPWSLYRNKLEVNLLFMQFPGWKEKLEDPKTSGWVEMEFSRLVEKSGLRYKYTFEQGNPYTTTPNLSFENGKLYQDGVEIAMFHFRRSKRWPL